MKRTYLILLLCLISMGTIRAEKVSVAKARTVAASFYNTFSTLKATANDAVLAHTFSLPDQSEGVFVFNIKDGFVMVSTDDAYRPIVGYSYEGNFDSNNISPELTYYINSMIEGRSYLPKQASSTVDAEWETLMTGGSIGKGNRESFFLCKTLWNQDYPYNYYAPVDNGHRTYAGCVACAMSQVMKYWDSPVRGVGYHQYNASGFGVLSANFDTTYYDWENMPNYINSASSWDAINAVSTLMYHCGIAVDMIYGVNGSGSYSELVPDAMVDYFSFTDEIDLRYRDDYSLAEWQTMLRDEFDQGWPVYYSGSEPTGGHAFVCDGYDDNDMFHFNWGWSGSGDGFYAIDALNVGGYHFNNWQGAIFNMVPRDIYENTPMPPSDFVAISSGDSDFAASLSWVNPETLRDGQELPAIDKVVLLRNGKVIYEAENAPVGAEMTFIDYVGMPIMAKYEVYVRYDNRQSMKAYAGPVMIGPACHWKINMTSSIATGWKGGSIIVRNQAFDTLSVNTLTSSMDVKTIDVPIGNITFAWKKPTATISTDINVAFNIIDSQDNNIFSYNGSINDLTEGTFLSANNNCGQGAACQGAITLAVSNNAPDVELSWNESDAELGYIIYRDGVLYDFVNENSYTDANALEANHSYSVTAFCSGGESEHSNIVCSSEQACESPLNFRYQILDNGKIQFDWDKPENSTGLRGYTIYRRTEGSSYETLKLFSSSATNYKMSPGTLVGRVYQFCITATYTGDCESAPGIVAGDSGLNYLEINNTILPLNLHIVTADDDMTIAWETSLIAESYNIYRNGQRIAENHTTTSYTDNDVEVGNSYCYTVTGNYGAFESGNSNVVCADFIATSTDENANVVSIAPNPTKGQINITSTQPIIRMEISNVSGQKIADFTTTDGNTLDLSQYGKGIYIVKIETSTDVTIRKVVVM